MLSYLSSYQQQPDQRRHPQTYWQPTNYFRQVWPSGRSRYVTPCSFVVGLRSSDTGTVDRVGRSGGSRPTVVPMLEAGLGRGLVWNGPHSWSSQCRSYFVVLYMLANTPAVLPRGEPAKGGTLCTQHPSLCGVARFFYFPKLPRSAHSLCPSRTPQFESCVLAPLRALLQPGADVVDF